MALIWPLVKSSTRRPAASSTNAPAARSATNGENVAAVPHEVTSRSLEVALVGHRPIIAPGLAGWGHDDSD